MKSKGAVEGGMGSLPLDSMVKYRRYSGREEISNTHQKTKN